MPVVATRESLIEWIRGWLERELELAPEDVALDTTFVRYGMDSVHAMMMVGDLEEHLELRLPPTLAWTYPTVEALAEHLAGAQNDVTAATTPATARSELLARLDDLPEDEIDRLLEQQQALAERTSV